MPHQPGQNDDLYDNSRTISVVYALGAPNFAMMLIGTITGVMGNIFNQEGYTNKDWISAAAGLLCDFCVMVGKLN